MIRVQWIFFQDYCQKLVSVSTLYFRLFILATKSTCNSVPQFTPCIIAMLINSVLAREQNTFALNIYLFNEFYDLPKLIIISKRNGMHF